MAVFVAVVEEGSFRRAGDRLRLSPSVVSHHVSKLEDRLGVSLLERAARSMSLTERGRILYQSARRMVTAAEEAVRAMEDPPGAPTGRLRLSISHFLAAGRTVALIEEFLLANPRISLDLRFHKTSVHPVDDGIELVISPEDLSDSQVASLALPTMGAAFHAAPDLAARIRSMEPAEVPARIPLILTAGFASSEWRRAFSMGPRQMLEFRLECPDIEMAHRLCRSGVGLAVLPVSMTEADLKKGELERVLPGITFPQMTLFANWPRAEDNNALTRAFIDHLRSFLGNPPPP